MGLKWKWFDAFNYSFMLLFCVSILLPFWDMLILSVSDPGTSASLTLRFWPKDFNLDSYRFAFANNKIIIAYVITMYRTLAGTLLTLILCVMAAYALSKKDLPFNNSITTLYITPLLFSGGMIPTYLLIRQLGLIDNLLVYILPGAVAIFSMLLIRNYFISLDKAVEESAFIDGAGYFTLLVKIITPLSKPILATVALWSLVGHWNAWFDSLIYIRDENKIVLQLMLYKILQTTEFMNREIMIFQQVNQDMRVASATFRAALTIITVGPVVLVYPFMQKHFVKGIMIGSLKG